MFKLNGRPSFCDLAVQLSFLAVNNIDRRRYQNNPNDPNLKKVLLCLCNYQDMIMTILRNVNILGLLEARTAGQSLLPSHKAQSKISQLNYSIALPALSVTDA